MTTTGRMTDRRTNGIEGRTEWKDGRTDGRTEDDDDGTDDGRGRYTIMYHDASFLYHL